MAISTLDIVLIVVGLIAIACAIGFGFLLWKRSNHVNTVYVAQEVLIEAPIKTHEVKDGSNEEFEQFQTKMIRSHHLPKRNVLADSSNLLNRWQSELDANQTAINTMENMIASVRLDEDWADGPIDANMTELDRWYEERKIHFNPREYRSQQPLRDDMVKVYQSFNVPVDENDPLFQDGLTLYNYIDARTDKEENKFY